MQKLPVIVILLFGLLFTGCGLAAPNGSAATGRDVTIDQALADWKNNSAIILDVRTPGEYAEGHIPGAKLIPLDQLSNRLSEVPQKGKIYIICRSGNRSNQAVSLLRDKGFSNVYNVTSGMNSWKGPVEK
ncbi:sulfurtransferase [Anaerosporomusa subterranea]|jgi:rhodanese-related sulfurtransferase|uniref:Sulfurtransferase n=1 Tax=Anaerosporomusa subterranea TaxID=1794912 RepID=A0A154BQM1_ANASB|nr:rhodanese-like domain-containing protein [Anaerosporomusa subterranea]KYZ76155.1 sulfurtransferase [Anaerosporomusa subterranea]